MSGVSSPSLCLTLHLSKIGICKHSLAVKRRCGLNCKSPLKIQNRSLNSLSLPETNSLKISSSFCCFELSFSLSMYSIADWSLMKLLSAEFNAGRISNILIIWSPELTTLDLEPSLPDFLGLRGKQELPLKRHLWRTSLVGCCFRSASLLLTMSETMHPSDHRSTAWSQSFSMKMISGGLYHREITWLERLLF